MTEHGGVISMGMLGQWRGSRGLAAGGFTAREGGVYYSKLDKSMIVILRSICVKV